VHLLKIIIQEHRNVLPFNEPARDLRIQNKPLWLVQRDALARYTKEEMELPPNSPLPETNEACIVYRDNLYFDENYINSFLIQAQKTGKAVRAAFTTEDAAFREHCLPLSDSYTYKDDYYYADLWYYPKGPQNDVEPLIIDLESTEIGYYHVPSYMANNKGELVYQVPLRCLIAIDSWVHVFIADTVFGLFGRGARFEKRLKNEPGFMIKALFSAMYEGKQILECSRLVSYGKNCSIDPTAVIHGPTTIGNNVTIGAGVVIENCIIGDNVNVSQGCNLMLSVIGDGTFLPFRASLFMTTIMENSMVAQNSCLQMCVVGRNSFIGAGTTFTDFNLLPVDIRARNAKGELKPANRPVLGGCVGHNCRIGAGLVIYPARMIESDVVIVGGKNRRVIDHDFHFEESDHHKFTESAMHPRLYRSSENNDLETW
jgi:carbonic anhydrase/acetyltransferase-like protein (isoleucine patch superfamily)